MSAVAIVIGLIALGQPSAIAATPPPPLPSRDGFYTYSGTAAQLAAKAPGTVLKTRSLKVYVNGNQTANNGEQLLYRTTLQNKQPAVTVATVISPLSPLRPTFPTPRLVSYQIAYDALDGKCDPSYYESGGTSSSGGTTSSQQADIQNLLSAGYTVVTPDYEGENLAWTAGQQSGMQTLDGIRAALNSGAFGLSSSSKAAVMGYSGGAIASEWAAELAAKYAPDLVDNLIGTAIGGVYVYPAHNLNYVSGTPVWAGVTPGALVGVVRAFGIDLDTYASSYGKTLFQYAKTACITDLLGKYPGLTFAQLVKPQYAQFTKVPTFVKLNNKLIMSTGGTPTTPMLMVQASSPDADGSLEKPGLGPGDGVMIAGDVRSLARTYCSRGVPVGYDEITGGEHVSTAGPWFTASLAFIDGRFGGIDAPPSSCGHIQPGNSLAPLPIPAASHNGVNSSRQQSQTTTRASTSARAQGTSSAEGTADTGTATERLLLWAALLLALGGGLTWAAKAPRPQPLPMRRRPLPYPRA